MSLSWLWVPLIVVRDSDLQTLILERIVVGIGSLGIILPVLVCLFCLTLSSLCFGPSACLRILYLLVERKYSQILLGQVDLICMRVYFLLLVVDWLSLGGCAYPWFRLWRVSLGCVFFCPLPGSIFRLVFKDLGLWLVLHLAWRSNVKKLGLLLLPGFRFCGVSWLVRQWSGAI